MKNKKLKPVLAVDFDGCLFTNEYPNIGEPLRFNIDKVKERKENGWDIVLFTCREGKELEEAVESCKKQGLEFDAVNESTKEWIEEFGRNPRKIGYTELFDDKATRISEGCIYCKDLCLNCYSYNKDEKSCYATRTLFKNKEPIGFCSEYMPKQYKCFYCGRALYINEWEV